MPGRKFSSNGYRYGFNGKEKDDEINSIDGAYEDFGARMYDSRLGRWLGVDRVQLRPSPYIANSDSPIWKFDSDGNTDYYFMSKEDVKNNRFTIDPNSIHNKGDRYFYRDGQSYKDVPSYKYGNNTFIQINSTETMTGSKRQIEKGKSVEISSWQLHSKLELIRKVSYEISLHPSTDPVTVAIRSAGGNGYDYMSYFAPNTLHFIDGIAYNEHEALNYLWGATMDALGYSEDAALIGAQTYSNYKYGEVNERSEDDAIMQGYRTLIQTKQSLYNMLNKIGEFKNTGVNWNGTQFSSRKQTVELCPAYRSDNSGPADPDAD